MVDIGVNLISSQYNGYHQTIFDHAYDAGLHGIIGISNGENECYQNMELLEKFKDHKLKLWVTIGVHPHNAKNVKDFDKMEKLYSDKRVVAIGECGLDYNRMFSSKQTQIEVFKRHLEFYKKYSKPLYLHDRDATDDMLMILETFMTENKIDKLNGVVHCFTSKREVMERYIKLGLYIGITGWICDKRRNSDLVESVKVLPLELLLVETDSPFLTPPEYGNKWKTRRNQPDSLEFVVNEIALIKKVSTDAVWNATMANTKKLFGIEF